MNDHDYLYRYYPLYAINKLENEIDKINDIASLLARKCKEGINVSELQPYCSLERIDSVIRNKTLWFSKADDFNDPFEFLGYFDPHFFDNIDNYNAFCNSAGYKNETLDEWKNLLLMNSLMPYRILSGDDKYYGICCFCGSSANSLMWSYYASGHSGICVRFRPHKKLNSIMQCEPTSRTIQLIQYYNNPSMIFGKMGYSDAPIIINGESFKYYKDERSKINCGGVNFSTEDLIHFDIMLGKPHYWSHENEYRLITLGIGGNLEISKIKYPNTDEDILSIDAIIFGLKTPPFVKQLIQNSYGNAISYFECTIVPGKYSLVEQPLEKSFV